MICQPAPANGVSIGQPDDIKQPLARLNLAVVDPVKRAASTRLVAAPRRHAGDMGQHGLGVCCARRIKPGALNSP
jgi:hypothetical protein